MASKLGIFSIIAGLVLGFFVLISRFMGTADFLVTMTISSFFQDTTDKVLELISNDTVYNALHSFFYEIHLSWVLVGLGVLLLMFGTFIRKD
ncbi:hypothetical protein [uncultured Desulfobacter sp.]|uniref:hypothetical protein n=1 Tax=uncultured Desulfobacter sp. TaxID=240139 RepID=UPI002AAB229F|nr:hypothetical protein [uncultured Desulfobacter sp.]